MGPTTENRIKALEDKALQAQLQPTERENLKSNLFDGIDGHRPTFNWKKKTYKVLTGGVFALTDAATVVTDCNFGSQFTLTTTQSFTMSTPLNPTDGKMIIYKIKQDSTGSRVVTWDTGFRGTVAAGLPVLSTTANYVDYVGFIYDATVEKWNCLADQLGFAT